MATNDSHRTLEQLAREATVILDRDVAPALRPEDDGKFIAIDVASGDYELDQHDYAAIARLRTRRPNADVWLGRVGQPAAYHIRRGR